MAANDPDYQRKYRLANPDKFRLANQKYHRKNKSHIASVKRLHRLKTRYGMTESDYKSMSEAQADCCAICGLANGIDNMGRNILHVDHVHATGRVRALLCGNCNRGIGMFKDDVELMAKAIAYVQKYNAH